MFLRQTLEEDEKWLELARDRLMWCVSVLAVPKFRIPQSEGKLLNQTLYVSYLSLINYTFR